jgi:hypothetical protein
MRSAIISLFILIFSTSLIAGEHGLTRITGTDIDLKMADHAIAGSIGESIIFGNKFEGKYKSELIIKKSGKIIKSTFGSNNSIVGGVIEEDLGNTSKKTTLRLKKIDSENQTLIMEINGTEAIIKIQADDFANNHFINPKFSVEYKGELIEFAVEDGHACYGFSSHLSFMILGAYIHQ